MVTEGAKAVKSTNIQIHSVCDQTKIFLVYYNKKQKQEVFVLIANWKKILKFGTLYGFSALCYQSELIEENDIDLYKSIETNKLKSKHSIQNIVNAIYICIEYHSLGGFKV